MRKNITGFDEFVARYQFRLRQIVDGTGTTPVDPDVVHPAQAMLLLWELQDIRAVARTLGTSMNHIQQIRARFMLLGLPGLHGVPRAVRFQARPGNERPLTVPPIRDHTPPSSHHVDDQEITALQIHVLP